MATRNGQVPIAISSVGDNVIVVPSNVRETISVIGGYLAMDSETTVQFKSGANQLTGPALITEIFLDKEEQAPWYITNPGESLIISLGDAVGCNGILYITRT